MTMPERVCQLCGEPMPVGEEMFRYHGHSGQCPTLPLPHCDHSLIVYTVLRADGNGWNGAIASEWWQCKSCGCRFVPESRLLAAEARVREVESERDARRERKVALMECEEREATLRAERDALKSRLKDLEDTLDTYWVNNVNKLKENLKEMEAERQKWIDHAIHVESTLRKEIDVLRTQLESHNA